MCLATVFLDDKNGQESEPLCTNIAKATLDGTAWIFTDLLDRQTQIQGTISSIDLVGNAIFITETKS